MPQHGPEKTGVYDRANASAPARTSSYRTIWIIAALIVLALILAYLLA
ncbi:MAG TPA: hypothetical protein VEB64_02490 [Azospirillaceae bacterium]|nr:hypothetical protein [Azospirillaceae bacterium]